MKDTNEEESIGRMVDEGGIWGCGGVVVVPREEGEGKGGKGGNVTSHRVN